MSLTVYVLPKGYVLDSTYINNPANLDYLAWKMGESEFLGTELWAIEAATDEPTVEIDDLLPYETETFELVNDTPSYGYTRTVQPGRPIAEVEISFLNQLIALWH